MQQRAMTQDIAHPIGISPQRGSEVVLTTALGRIINQPAILSACLIFVALV
jgi:hypothetical protein